MAEHSNTLVTVKSNSSLQTETEAQTDTKDEEQNEKAYIPLLLCESTVKAIPSNLRTIVENLPSYGGSDSNKVDLLISVLYVLMIETGFVPKQYKDMFDDDNIDFHKGRLDILTFLPEKWKSVENNSYRFEFVLTPFPDRICKMSCLVVNQNLIVNLLLSSLSKYCINLIPQKYVQEDIDSVSAKFINLKKLSIEFKNQVALPAKRTILAVEGVRHATLKELPTEVMYNIFIRQEAFDFLHLKATCKRMQACAKFYEHELWKIYFVRDFPELINEHEDIQDWYSKYKMQYEVRKLRSRISNSAFRGRKRMYYNDFII